VVRRLEDENNRLRRMIEAYHDSAAWPGSGPYQASSSAAIASRPSASSTSTARRAGAGLDHAGPNQERYPAYRHHAR
jgi:hypothetical protein